MPSIARDVTLTTGGHYRNHGVHFRIADGLISEYVEYFDPLPSPRRSADGTPRRS
jgi:ketosteroid isomerase-like protein